MQRRKFTREFKLEAVRLIRDEAYRIRRPRKTWASTSRNCAIG